MNDDVERVMEHYHKEARLWVQACMSRVPRLHYKEEERLARLCQRAKDDIEGGLRAAYLRLRTEDRNTDSRAIALMLGTWALQRVGQLICNIISEEQAKHLRKAQRMMMESSHGG